MAPLGTKDCQAEPFQPGARGEAEEGKQGKSTQSRNSLIVVYYH